MLLALWELLLLADGEPLSQPTEAGLHAVPRATQRASDLLARQGANRAVHVSILAFGPGRAVPRQGDANTRPGSAKRPEVAQDYRG